MDLETIEGRILNDILTHRVLEGGCIALSMDKRDG